MISDRWSIVRRTGLAVFFANLFTSGIIDAWSSPIIPTATPQYPTPPAHSAGTQDTLHGVASPKHKVLISAPREGVLAQIHVKEGEHVHKGQLLASMDTRVATAATRVAKLKADSGESVLHAQLEYQHAELRLNRTITAHKAKAASQIEVEEAMLIRDQARTAYELAVNTQQIAVASLQVAREQLESHNVRAPFDGRIVHISAQPGMTLTPSDPLLLIVSLQALEVELYLPAARFGYFKIADVYELAAEEPVNHAIRGVLTVVDPIIDPASRTFRCVFSVDNKDEMLPAGFAVRLDAIQAVPIPNSLPTATHTAVTTDEDTRHLFSVSDFHFADSDGDPMASLQITAVDSTGHLLLHDAPVTPNDTIPASAIADGHFTFYPAHDANGPGYAQFRFRVNDGTDFSRSTYTMTVNVTPVNDPPSSNTMTVEVREDTSYPFQSADFTFTDADGDALTHIQITSLPSAGSLRLNGVDVVLNDIATIADIRAGGLTFHPAPHASGTGHDTFTFRVHDGTAYSPSPYTAQLDVIAVNDAPTAAHNTVTMTEDTAYAFRAADFNFADVDGNSLTQIQITRLPSAGALKLDDVDVVLHDVITITELDAGHLTFEPVPDANGQEYSRFEFAVHDGAVYSALAYTMTVHVTAVNDAPTAAAHTVTTVEGMSYTFLASDFQFTDVDGDSLTQVQIKRLPTAGSLTLGEVTLAVNDIVPISQLTSGHLVYHPLPSAIDIACDTFHFTVHDGTASCAEPYIMTIDVLAVNYPPTAQSGTVTTREDTVYIFQDSDFTFTDLDGDSLSHIQITALASAGSLTLNGVAVALHDMIPIADINAGRLMFEPAPDVNGTGYDSVRFTVHDGTEYSRLAYTLTVDVIEVPDAPTATPSTLVIDEDTQHVFVAEDFAFYDADGDSLTQIQITRLPAAGLLTLDGDNVKVGEVIPVTRIDAGGLRYTPDVDTNGVDYTRLTFRVHDGTDYSLTDFAITVDVKALQDAPTAAHRTVSTHEDVPYTFALDDFQFADADGDSMTQVTITHLPALGTLQLGNTVLAVGDIVEAVDIAMGQLRFVPDPDTNNIMAEATSTRSRAESVNPIIGQNAPRISHNSRPTSADRTITAREDSTYVFLVSDFVFVDSDGHRLSHIKITRLELTGTLTLSGNPVAENDTITVTDIESGQFAFEPARNRHGVGADVFYLTVHDGSEYSAADYAMTLDVTAVNDGPTAVDNTVTTNEDTPYTFTHVDFGFNDIDGEPMSHIRITHITPDGCLRLNGRKVVVGDVIMAADIIAGNLTFEPLPNTNNTTHWKLDHELYR